MNDPAERSELGRMRQQGPDGAGGTFPATPLVPPPLTSDLPLPYNGETQAGVNYRGERVTWSP